MTARNGVRIAVVDDDRRILLLRTEDPADPDALRWELPGGGVDPYEDLRDAAKRELLQETGIEVEEVGIRVGVVQSELRQETVFVVHLEEGAPEPELERRHRWWPADEALPRVRVHPPHLARLLQDVR